MGKRVYVKKIDEEKKEIILEKEDKPLIIFFRRYWLMLLITALILTLTIFILVLIFTISRTSDVDKKVSDTPIEVSFGDELEVNVNKLGPISDEYATDLFNYKAKIIDNGYGVILINNRVSGNDFDIAFYSDGSAKKVYKNGYITRISPLSDGSYGISDDGVIDIDAKSVNVSITKKESYSYGDVTFYSDGSAEILLNDGNVSLFVRDSSDLFTNNILDSGVSSFTYKDDSIVKFSDGTAMINDNGTYYALKNESDVDNKDSYFKEIKRDSLDDGREIVYFSNGSAVIISDDEIISVRKSNAINVVNNKLYDITNSDYVSICDTKEINDGGKIDYYSNGFAVITKSNGDVELVLDSNDISLLDGNVNVDGNSLDSISRVSNDNGTTTNFNDYVVVNLNDGSIIIASKDDIIIDTSGNYKSLVSNDYSEVDDVINFTISNNNSSDIKYRVVIEESDRSTLDSKYINYKISATNGSSNGILSDNLWDTDTDLAGNLKVEGTNYILLDSTLPGYQSVNVSLLLYILDNGEVQNYLMDKYFYGTIKVYAWIEE